MFKKLLKGAKSQRSTDRKAELHRNFIRHEAKVGGTLFGATAPQVRREFFCLDDRTWIWHEEWLDQSGQSHIQTTRYDVRPNGILKSQHGKYTPLSPGEALKLYEAAREYRSNVRRDVYAFAS